MNSSLENAKLIPVRVPRQRNDDCALVVGVDMGVGTGACACSGAGAKQPPTLREFPVQSVAEVVAREREIVAAGTSLAALMERAGAALAAYVVRNAAADAKVLVLCGSGNNGGDGWVAARLLHEAGRAVCVLATRAPEDIAAEPACAAARGCAGSGTRVEVGDGDDAVRFATSLRFQPESFGFGECDVIVDCLLGTGFDGGAVKEPARSLIGRANAARAFCLACDVPSGMNADTGEAIDVCFRADATVTMIAPKRGLVAPCAAGCVGDLVVAPIEEA